MDWSIIVLIFICLSQDYAQACDEDCRSALIEEFGHMLNSKMSPIQAELGSVKSEIKIMGVTVADIYTRTDGLDERSSQSQLASEAVKKMQVTMSEDIRTVKEKFQAHESKFDDIETIKRKVESTDVFIKEIKTDLKAIQSELEELGEFRRIVKEEVQPIFTFLNDKLQPVNQMKRKITTIHEDVKLLDRKYGDTLDDFSDIHEWSEDIHKYTKDTTTKQNVMSDSLLKIQNIVESYEEIINDIPAIKVKVESYVEIINEIPAIKVKLDSYEEIINEIPAMKVKVDSCEEHIKEIKPIMNKVTSVESSVSEISEGNKKFSLNRIENDAILLDLKENLIQKLDSIQVKRLEFDELLLNYLNPDVICISAQCFVVFKDKQRNWEDSKTKCEQEGYRMAEPSDAVAVPLRKRLVELHGDGSMWVGAKSDGSKFVWQHSGMILNSNSSLWRPNYPTSFTSGLCLEFAVSKSALRSHPGQVYELGYHKNSEYPLCEVK